MAYIIDNTKLEFSDCPDSLNGKIMLERHIEGGQIKGWITMSPLLFSTKMAAAFPNAVPPLSPIDLQKTFIEYVTAYSAKSGYGKYKAVLSGVLNESAGVVAALQTQGVNVTALQSSINSMPSTV